MRLGASTARRLAIAVAIGLPAALAGLIFYAGTRPPENAIVYRCGRAVEGRALWTIELSEEQCKAIGASIAVVGAAQPDDASLSAQDEYAVQVGLGKPPPPGIALRRLPSDVTERFPELDAHRYFVAGDDIAVVGPTGQTVIAFVEVHVGSPP